MEKQKNIPQLRFPDFESEWKTKKYGDIYSFRNTNSFSREDLNYDDGAVKNIHYGDIHTKFATLFDIKKELVPFINPEIELKRIIEDNYCKEGDLIVADASEDYADVGKCIEIVNLNGEKVLAGLHTILARPDLYIMAIGFSGYLMKSQKIRLQIKIYAQGSKVYSISPKQISAIEITIPEIVEQTRIASFLTVIDKKITELKQKKSLLEQYKEGIMYKLFSQELRFKDDDGKEFPKWEKKKLRDLVEFRNGKAHEQEISEGGQYIVINSKFISTKGEVKKYSDAQICPLEYGEIVMVMSDVPNGKALAKCFYIDENDKYTLNQRICGLKAKGVDARFLFYILNRNSYYIKFDSGVGQTNLTKDEVLNCPLLVPASDTEQTKIANFLSAIDDKINHTQIQIQQTEQYKKGLLQQMFC
ncbi:MAG: restriction endonuclease subunit S [Bacteroidales bacterium]|nr:restriction endonuclease subunit S [Bacteroidales bacterium]